MKARNVYSKLEKYNAYLDIGLEHGYILNHYLDDELMIEIDKNLSDEDKKAEVSKVTLVFKYGSKIINNKAIINKEVLLNFFKETYENAPYIKFVEGKNKDYLTVIY